MADTLSQEDLEAAHCWEPADRVPGRPQMTEFRRRSRLHQTRWREAHGHPVGTQPIKPKPGAPTRLVGSRLPLAYARDSGANFLTAGALDAARSRTSFVEAHQSFDHQGLWADLLSSTALAVNLVGDLATDLARADTAVHTWWPDVPGTVCDVRFEHSPGRMDRAYLGGLRAFDVAFVLDLGDGTQGILGLDTKYHERTKREVTKPSGLPRCVQIAERSGVFRPGKLDAADRTDLTEMWLEHLLLLSMPQHVSGNWGWGRFVVVHPAGNSDFADACARYEALLVDRSTFATATVEQLVDADVLPVSTSVAFRERYLAG